MARGALDVAEAGVDGGQVSTETVAPQRLEHLAADVGGFRRRPEHRDPAWREQRVGHDLTCRPTVPLPGMLNAEVSSMTSSWSRTSSAVSSGLRYPSVIPTNTGATSPPEA